MSQEHDQGIGATANSVITEVRVKGFRKRVLPLSFIESKIHTEMYVLIFQFRIAKQRATQGEQRLGPV